jgi:hypothetical protein
MRENAISRQAVSGLSDNTATRTLDVFRSRARFWLDRGCSTRVAAVLANARIDSLDQVGPLGKTFFRQFQNVGRHTIDQLGKLIGGWPDERPTPQQAMADAFALALPGASIQDRLELAADAVSALYRNHYAISASK